jgi:hypothetical protein
MRLLLTRLHRKLPCRKSRRYPVERNRSVHVPRKNPPQSANTRLQTSDVTINEEVLGVSAAHYNSWELHTVDIKQKRQRIAFGVFCILEFPGCSVFCQENILTDTLTR